MYYSDNLKDGAVLERNLWLNVYCIYKVFQIIAVCLILVIKFEALAFYMINTRHIIHTVKLVYFSIPVHFDQDLDFK